MNIFGNDLGSQPRGLRNLGNTCFLNCILQSLSSCPSFINYTGALASSRDKHCFSSKVFKCIQELRRKTKSYFSLDTTNLMNILISVNPSFKDYGQQDALEAFETIMNLLKEEKVEQLKTTSFNHSMPQRLKQLKRLSLDGLTCRYIHDLYIMYVHMMNEDIYLQYSIVNINQSNNLSQNDCKYSHIECQECLKKDNIQYSHHNRYNTARHHPFVTLPLPIPTSTTATNNTATIVANSYIVSLKGGGRWNNLAALNSKSSSNCLNKHHSIYNCMEEYFRYENLSNVLCNSCSIEKSISALKHKQNLHTYTDKSLSSGGICNKKEQEYEEEELVKLLLQKLRPLRTIGSNDCFIQDMTKLVLDKMILPTIDGIESIDEAVLSNQSISVSVDNQLEMLWLATQQNAYCDVIKSSSISRLPKLLCLYICRRTYDEQTGKLRKLTQHVDFPLVLNMKRFLSADASFEDSFENTIVREHHLKAVVVHSGSSDAGHYVAYCLINDKPTRQWCYFSDDKHQYVPESEVLKVQATMLFYDSN